VNKVKFSKIVLIGIAGLAFLWVSVPQALAADTDDGISEFNEEPISADDNLGSKDTNVKFVVADAIAKAKMKANASKDDKDSGNDGKTRSNVNTGDDENNQNSVVVGAGSKVDKVYNIVIQK
jgi:hypothetical protein